MRVDGVSGRDTYCLRGKSRTDRLFLGRVGEGNSLLHRPKGPSMKLIATFSGARA